MGLLLLPVRLPTRQPRPPLLPRGLSSCSARCLLLRAPRPRSRWCKLRTMSACVFLLGSCWPWLLLLMCSVILNSLCSSCYYGVFFCFYFCTSFLSVPPPHLWFNFHMNAPPTQPPFSFVDPLVLIAAPCVSHNILHFPFLVFSFTMGKQIFKNIFFIISFNLLFY